MSITLSFCGSDGDFTRPLLTGDIEPDGIDLLPMTEHPPRRHRRFFRSGEFDVCEVSLASYLSSVGDPEYPFTAIPVFPSRRFRHSFVYTQADADVESPADLAGGTVGTQSWQTTATVWLRGIFDEHHSLNPETITWVRRREDDVPIDIPDRFEVRSVPGDSVTDAVEQPRTLRDLLVEGELDAVMDPSGSLFHDVVESDGIDFLFSDPKARERQYFAETGIYPIMHTVAIRDDILETHPWVAVNLYDAFCAARDLGLERARSPSTHMALAWGHIEAARQRTTLGPGEDVWEYGLTDTNQLVLETFIEYAAEQGLIAQEYDPDAMFVDSTLGV